MCDVGECACWVVSVTNFANQRNCLHTSIPTNYFSKQLFSPNYLPFVACGAVEITTYNIVKYVTVTSNLIHVYTET